MKSIRSKDLMDNNYKNIIYINKNEAHDNNYSQKIVMCLIFVFIYNIFLIIFFHYIL